MWHQEVGAEHPVQIPDDLMHYLHDSLQWVKSTNPAKNYETGWGFNLYGPTGFSGESAALVARILRAWAVLFECGPETLRLRLGADREQTDFPRDEVTESLKAVAALAEQASDEGHWLLHIGV
jgi:hypothetical protein